MLSDRQSVEVLHLHFLRLLFAGRGKENFVVKGGINLRFFFGSIRYSEDLDLDVRAAAAHAVAEHVERILGSKALREVLAVLALDLVRVTAPKQTPTTQRWKVELRPRGLERSLHTKIEFSHREAPGETAVDSVETRILETYGVRHVVGTHYLLPTAVRQKVGALVGRREVQARDVFDLSVLFARAKGELPGYEDLQAKVPAAIERVWAISYDDYRGQVLSFLEPEHADPESSPAAWEAMQLQVVSALERIGRTS